MIYSEAGALVPGDDAVELAALSAEYALRRDLQQERQLGNKIAAVFEQPLRHRRSVVWLALTEVGHRAGQLVILCHTRPQQDKSCLRFLWIVWIVLWFRHIALAAGKRPCHAATAFCLGRLGPSAAGSQAQRQHQTEKCRKGSAQDTLLHRPPPS